VLLVAATYQIRKTKPGSTVTAAAGIVLPPELWHEILSFISGNDWVPDRYRNGGEKNKAGKGFIYHRTIVLASLTNAQRRALENDKKGKRSSSVQSDR